MDPQLQTMIQNMPEKTGKSLEQWFELLAPQGFEKHGQMMNFLKKEHGVTHGFANTICILFRQKEAGGPKPEEDLVSAQYSGAKAGLKPIYDAIIKHAESLGSDMEIAPKKAYVSLRRSKQFAIVKPATKTRMDIGFNLKEAPESERLQGGKPFSGMCSHMIQLTSLDEVDEEFKSIMSHAYDQA